MKRTIIASLLLATMLAGAGCSTLGDTWDSTWTGTKKLYSEYVNTDPQVDLEKVEHSQWEEQMSKSLTPVDSRLSDLMRHMGLLVGVPDQAWMDRMFTDFPWISGCVVARVDGSVIAQRPDAGMKPLNLQPFVDVGLDFKDRAMRAFFDDTPLGPEIYVAAPVFDGNAVAGFTAVHFDMRNLMAFSDAPDDLIVVTPDMVQWSGRYDAEARDLAQFPWNDILTERMQGTEPIGGREFIWLARYIGDKSMVYAIQAHMDEPGSSWWTFGLF